MDKNRIELYDIIVAKFLHHEKSASDAVVKYIMQSQRDYIVREIEGIIFVMGRCGEIVNPGFIAHFAKLEAVTGCYLMPLLSRASPLVQAIAREFHDRCHSASVQFMAREIRHKWYISHLIPYLKKSEKGMLCMQETGPNSAPSQDWGTPELLSTWVLSEPDDCY